MKTLVVDNIDSFVYNLVQYVGILDGNPVVVENTATESMVDELMAGVTHIIISPGPKTPVDAGISNYVIEEYGKVTPLLGVCLGHQCIGHVYGGRIRPAKTLMHGKTSVIDHDDNGIFTGTKNPLTATRYHSLVVDEEKLPRELKITARSKDDDEIMGLKHTDYPVYGLQFHPESILTPDGMTIIKNFLKLK